MVEILVPSSSIELTAHIQQALLVAKQNGFAVEEVTLGVSSASQFEIKLADIELVIGADLIGSASGVSDFYLSYTPQSSEVAAPSQRSLIAVGLVDSHNCLDVWYHPLADEVRALSYSPQFLDANQQQRHLSWVVTLLSLGFPIEDSLTVARAMMNVSRETWASEYRHYPRPVLDDPRLGIQVDWSTQCKMQPFAYLDKTQMGLYPVVDSVEWIERLLKLGVRTLQLRIKDASQVDLEAQVSRAIALGKQYNGHVYINDYWQLAIKHGAYGVHLGQEDIEQANLSLINQAGIRLGLSTHGYFELLRISQLQPSYIALGHIFPTTTKQMPSKPQGLVRLALYQRLIDTIPFHHELGYPTVAIGGIDLETAPAVWCCGVSSLAVVRAITLAAEPKRTMLGFAQIMQPRESSSVAKRGAGYAI
ncbi:thiamine-phosphate pyrophosphorylase [Vibrio ichthyoenteri ATCC 700023]|uniref:Thiamine-phosphate pyrophosphorylase n=1 Tax=Vibrio ichthyoenteri ATCC 700023 TaxID=870968 RepID=F9S403_9VIBR|nr:thiamine phosphate synthase [Vibrio ichthyoenteri]EGU37334.1 thiamine-phosphate pyrophosphorylase [Vibrio ichthyoenteri ATCC 700023]